MSLLQQLLDSLQEKLELVGLNTIFHYPPQRAKQWTEPVVVLGVRTLELSPGGFSDYLGTETDTEDQSVREVYGSRGNACIGMDVYCAMDGGDTAALAEKTMDAAVQVLLGVGDTGVAFSRYTQGEVGFDSASGMYRIRAEVQFDLYLTGRAAAESAGITDFRLGEITVNV